MRLFFAIELPDTVKSALGRLRPQADQSYRWVEPQLMHVTLAFLGEQPETALRTLEAVGEEAAAAAKPARLTTAGLDAFGSKRSPRVLVVQLGGDIDALVHLQAGLDQRLRQAGFALEDRAFRPHITLARRRQDASGGPPGLAEPARVAFPVERLTLFQSRLSPRGPTYTPLAQFPIGGYSPASQAKI